MQRANSMAKKIPVVQGNTELAEKIEEGKRQISQALQLIVQETNPLIEEKLKKNQYTTESIQMVKSAVSKIKKFIQKASYLEA